MLEDYRETVFEQDLAFFRRPYLHNVRFDR